MATIEDDVRQVMDEALGLDGRSAGIGLETPLLGSLPELDSMAVATLILAIENALDIYVEDDEISAETFETFGTLVAFVESKVKTASD